MRRALGLALVTSLSLTPGCGTMLFHNPEDVLVEVNVPDAFVRAAGEGQSCKGSGKLNLDRGKDHVITISADGYETQTVRVNSQASWWRILVSVLLNGLHGVFTLFISTVIGCGVDAGAGAWQVLETDEVSVSLARTGFEARSDQVPQPLPAPSAASPASARRPGTPPPAAAVEPDERPAGAAPRAGATPSGPEARPSRRAAEVPAAEPFEDPDAPPGRPSAPAPPAKPAAATPPPAPGPRQQKSCAECGTGVPEGARFCPQCGAVVW